MKSFLCITEKTAGESTASSASVALVNCKWAKDAFSIWFLVVEPVHLQMQQPVRLNLSQFRT